MTLPSERKKGYMKKLMNFVLEDLKGKYSLVFLQTESPELYEKYGFRKVEEQFFSTTAFQNTSLREKTLKKLNFSTDEDAAIIRNCFANQQPRSHILTPLYYQHSLFLNLYNPSLAEKLYYSVSLKVLIVYEVSERVLKIYDVIGEATVTLSDICAEIPEIFSSVVLYFTPDGLINLTYLQTTKKEGTLMVRGELSIGNLPVAFPITASF
jgi:predicted acetyltransferase